MPSEFILIEASSDENDKVKARVTGLAYAGGKMSIGWGDPVIVDLEGMRISRQIPLLANHENRTASRIGVVTPTIEGGELVIDGKIVSTSATAGGIIEQAKNGADWQLSIGAEPVKVVRVTADDETKTINGQEFDGPFYHVMESKLREVSVVAVGADEASQMSVAASLKLINCKEPKIMPGKKEDVVVDQVVEPVNLEAKMSESAKDAVEAERARVAAIKDLCAGEFQEVEDKAISAGWDVEEASKEVLKAMREARPEAPEIVVPDRAKTTNTLIAALSLRAGIDGDSLAKEYGEKVMEAAQKDRGMSLQQLFVECARMEGKTFPRTFSNDTIRAGFSTVSLSDILSNIANKRLLKSFDAQPVAAIKLCSAGDLNDFKEAERYRLTDTGDLQQVAPDGEIQHGGLSDEKATNQLATYGKMLALTRQMIYNDDLGAFLKVPEGMGARAARLIDHLFFTRLLSNPSSLFSSGNGNYQSGSATALDADSLGDAMQLFMDQVDSDDQPISVAPKFLLVPTALKFVAKTILQSSYFTAVGNTDKQNIPTYNPYADEDLVVVSSPYLANTNYTGHSSLGWYLFGSPAVVDTFEIGYLRGRRTPTVEQADADFNTLGMQFRVYFDLGIREMDHRGMVFSKGEA